jgi:xanthine dehydrogenase accessory factor
LTAGRLYSMTGTREHWLDALDFALARDERVVVATVADARGPTPREAGATMIVAAEGVTGTIGGGTLEHEATRIARESLARRDLPASAWLVRFPLGTRQRQPCGGVATVAFQIVSHSDSAWLDTARACLRTQPALALVSRIGASTGGARLLVTADDARGSLGDTTADSAAIAAARDRLAAGPGDGRGDSCVIERSAATLFIHVVRRPDFAVLVFGNGHVGRALVHVLAATTARITWIDQRADGFPAQLPANVEAVATATPEAELRAAPAGCFVVILTHSHALDFELARVALGRSDWRYVGVIGSTAKRAQLARALAEHGYSPDALARITMPIGVAGGGIRSKEPGAIAIAVAAELLAVRERAGVARSASSTAAV